MIVFEDMSVMSRATSLAYYETLGDAAWMNFELEKYNTVTTQDILEESRNIFRKENCNTIYYLSRQLIIVNERNESIRQEKKSSDSRCGKF